MLAKRAQIPAKRAQIQFRYQPPFFGICTFQPLKSTFMIIWVDLSLFWRLFVVTSKDQRQYLKLEHNADNAHWTTMMILLDCSICLNLSRLIFLLDDFPPNQFNFFSTGDVITSCQPSRDPRGGNGLGCSNSCSLIAITFDEHNPHHQGLIEIMKAFQKNYFTKWY